MKCKHGYEIQVLHSSKGYYRGTVDSEGVPNCRISRCYAFRKDDAENLPLDRQLNCIENEYCNRGNGCFRVFP